MVLLNNRHKANYKDHIQREDRKSYWQNPLVNDSIVDPNNNVILGGRVVSISCAY